jgi:hypothetical protein
MGIATELAVKSFPFCKSPYIIRVLGYIVSKLYKSPPTKNHIVTIGTAEFE